MKMRKKEDEPKWNADAGAGDDDDRANDGRGNE